MNPKCVTIKLQILDLKYKNKKNFFKRLFTLDFKKITKYKYKIVNTNELLKGEDIRIIEQQ